MPFEAEKGSPIPAALKMLRTCYDQRLRRLPDGVDASFAPRWSEIIHGLNRKWALRGFEAALLFALRKGLRNGTVWVPHSLSYRRHNEILIPASQWASARQRFLDKSALLPNATPYIQQLVTHLSAGLKAVDEALRAGEIRVDKDGVHLKAIRAATRLDDVERTARKIFGAVGTVQLPELMLAIDNETRFSWTLLGREPTSERDILSVYAGLLAHGTEQDALGVSLMIPSSTEEENQRLMCLVCDGLYSR